MVFERILSLKNTQDHTNPAERINDTTLEIKVNQGLMNFGCFHPSESTGLL